MSESFEVIVVGAGIVGLATATALQQQGCENILVLEAESKVASHQTGHNSGVIHSGLYYKPGSLKAKNCARGRELMIDYCRAKGIPHERCGKVVVATQESEIEALRALEAKGKANGLTGMTWLNEKELSRYEPHARGVAALHVLETGIVDYKAVCNSLVEDIRERGGLVRTFSKVEKAHSLPNEILVETDRDTFRAKGLVNCAGLQADRVARLCGLSPSVRIVPFRGEYYKLRPGAESLVKNLIYPVPDPRFPFLGVHFTRMIGGGVEAGPNAVLALKREGYSWSQVSIRDLSETVGFSGFWKMAARYWKTGAGEVHRSFSKRAFVLALRKLIPDLQPDDIIKHGAGVRAQALGQDGKLLDDFCVLEGKRMIHVLNAPSPAATASLSIGESIAETLLKKPELKGLERRASSN